MLANGILSNNGTADAPSNSQRVPPPLNNTNGVNSNSSYENTTQANSGYTNELPETNGTDVVNISDTAMEMNNGGNGLSYEGIPQTNGMEGYGFFEAARVTPPEQNGYVALPSDNGWLAPEIEYFAEYFFNGEGDFNYYTELRETVERNAAEIRARMEAQSAFLAEEAPPVEDNGTINGLSDENGYPMNVAAADTAVTDAAPLVNGMLETDPLVVNPLGVDLYETAPLGSVQEAEEAPAAASFNAISEAYNGEEDEEEVEVDQNQQVLEDMRLIFQAENVNNVAQTAELIDRLMQAENAPPESWIEAMAQMLNPQVIA